MDKIEKKDKIVKSSESSDNYVSEISKLSAELLVQFSIKRIFRAKWSFSSDICV